MISEESDDRLTIELVAFVDANRNVMCHQCNKQICGHELLFSNILGLKNAPRCLSCLCQSLDRDATELRDDLHRYVRQRECYSVAWERANNLEDFGESRLPSCLWPESSTADSPNESAASNLTMVAENNVEQFNATDTWDAGDMACGELVMGLRIRLKKLPAHSILHLIAKDPAAPEDIPAWCRLTGHRLVGCQHPDYHIEVKEN